MFETPEKARADNAKTAGLVGLAAIVLLLAFLDVMGCLAAWRLRNNEIMTIALGGALIVQPMLFGAWSALGPNVFLLRLPFVIAAQCFILLCVLYTAHAVSQGRQIDWEGYVGMPFVTLVEFLASCALGGFVRWWRRQSIQPECRDTASGPERFQFSLRYLLAVMTVYAILLAMASRIQLPPSFGRRDVPWPQLFFQACLVAAICWAICLPTMLVPWLVLSQKPRVPLTSLALLCWFVWTLLVMVIMNLALPGPAPDPELIVYIFVVQFGAAMAGLFSALLLHAIGYRLFANKNHTFIEGTRGAGSMSVGGH